MKDVPNDRARGGRSRPKSFVAREMARRRDRPVRSAKDRHTAISHEDREISRRGHLVLKLRAKDTTGRWAYYVLLIAPHKERVFHAALADTTSVDLTSFGTILASNYGETPSPATREEIKRRFGFDL